MCFTTCTAYSATSVSVSGCGRVLRNSGPNSRKSAIASTVVSFNGVAAVTDDYSATAAGAAASPADCTS